MEGNHKQPARNPVGESHGWAKESAAREHLERAGKLAGCATGMANKPEEDEKKNL